MVLNRESILNYMKQDSYRPLTYQELLSALEVEDESEFAALLGRMEKDGDIVVTRKHKYGVPEMMNLVRGSLQVNAKGFAFLLPDDPSQPEVFIYERDLNGAMHRDRVMVRINRRQYHAGQKPEGEVIRAIKRANHEVVGTYRKRKNISQVIPDDPRLLYPINARRSTKIKVADGQKVVVRITSWPERDKLAEGKIIEVLGSKGDPRVDIRCVVKKYGLAEDFPKKVEKEAMAIPSSVQDHEIAGRRDLRDLKTVTIDGDDAKDLDDAVSITRLDDGYRLGVHIADVSHYVREGTAIDKEAYRRGTSVYLVDRVLPMLPVQLSNGICSLNAGEDRLAMSVIMDIDSEGNIIDYEICKAVIRVDERMTYNHVNRILKEQEPELMERYREYVDMFTTMHELAAILRRRRFERGALDFEFPETKVVVDEQGFPVAIEKRVQDVAESIIEEFMICANEVVARHCHEMQLPVLYRVHEKPDGEDLQNLLRILSLFNHRINDKEITPQVLQQVLNDVKGKPEQRIVSTMILRSLKHARYSPVPLGHYGLASPYYLHFTAPIRRYPDLLVHRVLTHLLEKGSLSKKKKAEWESLMPLAGEQCTLCEMQAEEAERESVDIKAAQYMKQFLGEVFQAVISSITAFGFFVELENTVEGLVHISTLVDDYYVFDEQQMILMGKHTRKVYRIGDEVEVVLVKVNVDEAKIDFELAEQHSSNGTRQRRRH
ncbi:MAG: ribonuclease R [Syntrophomonadaceae bacterium]|nr:ribonuclease R [Syntrophomonadaceae bacterium]